ncbi:hypothetical protein ACFVYG_08690 [Streptomyces sp. NPDC058256]|uniref:hypothetical protein n=1 Tax=Streptomyces sp. NPDC058256 TaxID=3346408 RepID=UPI0036E89879
MKKLATHSWSAREALARREPFTTHGAFRAVDGYLLPFGNRLPPRWWEKYRADGDEIEYTVLSYQTPIAWVLRSGEVVIPDVKYSLTTTDHQSLLYALNQPANGPLAIAAQEERQAARERAARRRRQAVREGAARSRRAPVIGDPRDTAVVTEVEELIRSLALERPGTPERSSDIVARIDDVLSRPVPANSGEAAIYSAQYLERKYGPVPRAEAA